MMNALRQQARTGPLDTVQAAAGPVRVSVEANEDHVPSRGWEGAGRKLGWAMFMKVCTRQGRERKLRNLFYFGVLCRGNTEALCTAVWRHWRPITSWRRSNEATGKRYVSC